jgi:hypothetical protein
MSIRRRGRELVTECDVYLSGRYAEYLETRNRPIPDWAWLSVLAHAPPEQLRALVAQDPHCDGRPTRTTVWWQAVGFLAGEILSRQDSDQILDELRRSVLVPLELTSLAAGRPLQRPRQLVRMVLCALDQHQLGRHR